MNKDYKRDIKDCIFIYEEGKQSLDIMEIIKKRKKVFICKGE